MLRPNTIGVSCVSVLLILINVGCRRASSSDEEKDAAAPSQTENPPGDVSVATDVSTCKDPIVFADPYLEGVVRRAIEKEAEPILAEDLVGLKELSARNVTVSKRVSGLEGIECLHDLERLDFYENDIVNIEPLTALKKLTELDLSSNPIEDYSPIAFLTTLTNLILYHHTDDEDSFDISFLSTLTGLKSLSLRTSIRGPHEQDFTSLEPLSHLRELTFLDIEIDGNRDLSPMGFLQSLTELHLVWYGYPDLSPIGQLNELRILELMDGDTGTQSKDISFLKSLDKLETLALYLASDDFSALRSLTQLKSLDARFVYDASIISDLTQLTELTLYYSDIDDLSFLAHIATLEYLDLPDNKIADLAPLNNLTNLSDLRLTNNNISDITPLANLPNLSRILLSGNPVQCTEDNINLIDTWREAGIGVGVDEIDCP